MEQTASGLGVLATLGDLSRACGLPPHVLEHATKRDSIKTTSEVGGVRCFDRHGQVRILGAVLRSLKDPRWQREQQRETVRRVITEVRKDRRQEFRALVESSARRGAVLALLTKHKDEIDAQVAARLEGLDERVYQICGDDDAPNGKD